MLRRARRPPGCRREATLLGGRCIARGSASCAVLPGELRSRLRHVSGEWGLGDGGLRRGRGGRRRAAGRRGSRRPCRGSAGSPRTSWARNTRAPEPGRHRGRRQRADQPLADRQVERLADEVLVGQRDQHRPAGGDQLVEPPGGLQRVPGVLAEVVAGSIRTASRRTPERDGALGRGDRHGATTSATTSSYATRCGRVRGASPPACVQTSAGAELGGHLGQPRVDAAPGVVEQVGAGLAADPADLGPPGVDADDQRRGAGARTAATKPGGAPDLLGGVDLVAGPGLDPADVDDRRRPRRRPGRTAVERRGLAEGRALVVERVRGAVHDRHHQQVVVGERPAPRRNGTGCSLLRRAASGPVGPGVARSSRGFVLRARSPSPCSARSPSSPPAAVTGWAGRPRPRPARGCRPTARSSGDDVDQVRFGVAFRGYRMDEVDEVLDRLAERDRADRDARIDELEQRAPAADPIRS